MAGTATAVGDNSGCTFHDRLPIGIGHVGDQDVTRIDLVHLFRREHYLDRTTPNTLANGTTRDQGAPFLLEVEAFELAALLLRYYCFRTRLDDVKLTVITIQCPLDIHGALIMLFDRHGLTCQRHDLII